MVRKIVSKRRVLLVVCVMAALAPSGNALAGLIGGGG